MSMPYPAAALSQAQTHQDTPPERRADAAPDEARKPRMLRKYRIQSLRADGSVHDSENIGPATAIFETAFSAFARGTLIKTTTGPVAIEDLAPGASVITAEHGPSQVLWVGSMTLVPHVEGLTPRDCRVTRIMPDAFGMERPMLNMMAGPGARLLARPASLRDSFGGARVLTPARDLADGVQVVEVTPPSAITVYHLCLRRHATIIAGGLECESFHPGAGFERQMGQNMLSLFLSFFPHIRKPGDFGDLAHPRLPFAMDRGVLPRDVA